MHLRCLTSHTHPPHLTHTQISSNAQATMPWLLAEMEQGTLDVVVLIGDHAYDLQSNNGATGDAFMVQLQPLVANLPWHSCPG